MLLEDWNPWGPSALHDFLHDGGAAFDMREPEHYYGLSRPNTNEFIVMLQHTSLRPDYEGVTHFGATLVDEHNKPLPADHPRESCEARMVVSFKIKGEVTRVPSNGQWSCYKLATGQIFYANDKTRQTAWMPDDKSYFPSLTESEFEAVREQLTHQVRPSPIPYSQFEAESITHLVSRIY